MATATIDLQQFCIYTGVRYALRKPWREGEYVYATDGAVAIRVNARDFPDIGPPDGKVPRNLDEVLRPAMDLGEWLLWPHIPLCENCQNAGRIARACDCGGTGKEVCSACDGYGVGECDMGYEHECEECKGSGHFKCGCDPLGTAYDKCECSVVIGQTKVARHYAAKLASLPHVHYKCDAPNENIAVRFEGGIGMLCCLRY